MKRRVTSVFFVVTVMVIAMGSLVFGTMSKRSEAVAAEGLLSRPKLEAHVSFLQNKSDNIILVVTNNSNAEFVMAEKGHYIDNAGSAGSWTCSTEKTVIRPGETKSITYRIEVAADHGHKSILSYYFYYQNQWYLGKTGIDNGTEYYLEHI